MPRLSSLRPLRSLATSGVLSACLFGGGVVSFAQSSSDYPSSTPPGYPSSTPPGGYGSGAPGQQDPNALQNAPSGIKRSDVSSVVPLQALLYSDVDQVLRVNFSKIDYVGLNDFFGEVVDKGVGSIQSSDSYRVKLRDYQKSELKASFRAILSALQNFATQQLFANKIDEAYFVKYATGGEDQTTVVAVPTDGLSEADQKLALEKLEKQLKPIAIFNRYGFVVAVVDHRNAADVDLQAIQESYLAQAQLQNAQNGAGYGSSSPSSYGSSGYGSQTVSDVPNDLNLPDALYREYAASVEEARTNAKTESRKKVLPYVRRRFQKPADAGSPFFDALKQTDGAAIAAVVDADGLQAAIAEGAQAKSDDVATVLAGSFAASDADEEKTFDLEALASQPYFEGFKTATLAASLVGSPKLAVIVAFDSPETAKKSADAANAALTVAKPLAAQQLIAATKGNADADLTPLVDAVFASLKPQTAGSQAALVVDFDVFKQNAIALVPLFGGVETKSAQEMESDGIDWDLGAEGDEAANDEADAPAEEATEDAAPADDEAEDDPFGDEADATDEEAPAETDEDDPFGDEEAPAETDEDDPFGDEEEKDPFA